MANYLERIVAAGARTASPAKPAVGAPPTLPATLLLTPSIGPATWGRGSRETPRRTAFEPSLREAPRDSSVLAEAVSRPVDVTSNFVPSVSTERIPEFRNTSSGAETAPIETPPVQVQSTGMKASESVEPPRPKEQPDTSVSSRVPEQARPAMPAFFRWDAPIRIEAPRGMRPPKARAETPTPTPIETKTTAATPPADVLSPRQPAAELIPVAVGESESTPPTPRTTASAPIIEATESKALVPAQPKPESPIPVVAPLVSAPVPAATPVPNPPIKKQGRISIGSVEVRVNNQPAPAKSVPARHLRPVHSDPLGSRYLNRFALKP
jgi:hypothetical protein